MTEKTFDNFMSSLPVIGGTLSSIFGNLGNRRIQQMNNEFAERMMEKQMAYNDKVTDPSYIRKRLQAAGYNPNLAVGSGSLGQVQGVSQPQPSQRTIDASGFVQGLGMAIDNYRQMKAINADNAVKDAQAHNLRIEGKYIASKALADLAKVRADTKSVNVRTAIDEIIRSFTPDMQGAELNYKVQQTNQLKSTIKLQQLEYFAQSERLKFLPQQIKLELANASADLALRLAQGELTRKQVKHEIKRIALTSAQASSASSQAKVDSATIGNRIEILEQEMWRAIYNSGSDNIIQGVQTYASKFGDWWRSLYPFK